MVSVRFGNLSISQFEEKAGIEFSKEDKAWLEARRTNNAQTQENDKFHIFDLPLGIIAGFDVYDELVKRLTKYDYQKSFYVEKKEKGADESTPSPDLPF